MSNPFKQLYSLFKESREKKKYNRRSMRINELLREAEDNIQVREFDGKLYIAYKDIPLIDQTSLQTNILHAVQDARHTATAYNAEKEKL